MGPRSPPACTVGVTLPNSEAYGLALLHIGMSLTSEAGGRLLLPLQPGAVPTSGDPPPFSRVLAVTVGQVGVQRPLL